MLRPDCSSSALLLPEFFLLPVLTCSVSAPPCSIGVPPAFHLKRLPFPIENGTLNAKPEAKTLP